MRTHATNGRQFIGRCITGLFCVTIAMHSARSEDAVNAATLDETDYSTAIDLLRAAIHYEVQQKDLPAFSISLVEKNRVVWAGGFGFQDEKRETPATAATVYRVGSVSKLFTDVSVMQLVERGKLDLDVPVQKYLPKFSPRNPYDTPITLRQLMSHQSGLVRESPVGNYFDPTEPTLNATVQSLNDTELVYRPGSKTKYSNAAVSVVGAILEQVSGELHADRVQEQILEPLRMRDSSFIAPKRREKLATGWMRTNDGRRFTAPEFMLGTGPAGNMYSSVTDLAKFLVCMFAEGESPNNGRVLQSETYRLMVTQQTDSDGNPLGFGLGFRMRELDGMTKIGHGGAVYGFSTQLEALPERTLGVAAVASLDGSNGVVSRIADYALRLMLATQDHKPLPEYQTTKRIPSARANELVGLYREADGSRFARITEFGGQVQMQRGSFQYQVRAAADDGRFLTDDYVGYGVNVNLVDDQITIDDTTFVREPDGPPNEVRPQWKGLIGEYGWDHNTLYILEDDDQLFALIEWFYYYPLKQVSDGVFAFPDYGLYHGEELEFSFSDDGVATEVVAAEVRFVRREVGTKDGETFKIVPVTPIAELRAEALAASPPPEHGNYREPELVELQELDRTIQLDIRYATTNNFTGSVFYKEPRAFMQRLAAEAVVRANKRLKPHGLGLLIHDAYRPWHVTKMFWDATPNNLKDFVANPANGSRHNRGCAVDLTLFDLASGKPIQMVAGYDEFSPRSFPLYPGGTSRQRWYRQLLRQTMESEGFSIYEFEWWHFDFRDWKQYRIGNVSFSEILAQHSKERNQTSKNHPTGSD